MVTHGIPNDVVNNLNPLAFIIFIPICDLFIYPSLRKIGINFTPIKRITAGFLTCSAAMIWAAVVQHYIYKVCSTTFDDEELSDLPRPYLRPIPVGISYLPAKTLRGTASPLLSASGHRVDRIFS